MEEAAKPPPMTPPLITKFKIDSNSSFIVTPPKYVRIAVTIMKSAINNPVVA